MKCIQIFLHSRLEMQLRMMTNFGLKQRAAVAIFLLMLYCSIYLMRIHKILPHIYIEMHMRASFDDDMGGGNLIILNLKN